jgi:hypothetical protein
MAHPHPSEYFDPITKQRTSRACSSGKAGCLWSPNQNIEDWQVFMEDLAFETTGEDLSDVYLNAGLMVGYPSDLINLLNVLNIDPSEDDQAVLSGLMYHFPDMIKLDYKQEMFGNNQWPRGLVDGCVFEPQGEHLSLVHTETGTEPLILHTPGKFYDCLDILIEDLGGVSQQRYLFGLEHMNEVATNNGFTVASERGEFTQRHALKEGVSNDPSASRRKLAFFSRVFEMVEKIRGKMTQQDDASVRIVTTPEIKEEDSNYGISNYGIASNYGEAISDNYGVANNYGVATTENYGVSNYGLTALDDEGAARFVPENYGIASNYGVANAGNYGTLNYGTTNYGVAKNYGTSNYGVIEPDNYGNYGLRRRRRRHRTV